MNSPVKRSEMKRVNSPSDVPMGHHYAVLVYESTNVHHEGDERSRTNPGHGYPAYDETVNTFEHWVTESKEEWESFVKAQDFKQSSQSYKKTPFVFFEVACRGRLEKTVTLKIETP